MTNPNKTLEAAALDKAKAAYDAFGYPQSSHLGLEAGIRAYLGALPLPLVEGEATMPSAAVLRGLGYAPGDYLNECRVCGQQFTGDKRAVACEDCAIKAALPSPTSLQKTQPFDLSDEQRYRLSLQKTQGSEAVESLLGWPPDRWPYGTRVKVPGRNEVGRLGEHSPGGHVHVNFPIGSWLGPLSQVMLWESHRDMLGRAVRVAWVKWAKRQPDPKPTWLVPYDDLDEDDKEADRLIGEALSFSAASPPDTDSIRNGVIDEAIAAIQAIRGNVSVCVAALRSLRSGLV